MDGKVVGAVGLQEEPVVFKAKVVILATGGSGGLYTRTDVPLNMTGDGYALAKEESRGAHFRLDYPKSSDEWLRPLLVRKTGDGPEVSL